MMPTITDRWALFGYAEDGELVRVGTETSISHLAERKRRGDRVCRCCGRYEGECPPFCHRDFRCPKPAPQ